MERTDRPLRESELQLIRDRANLATEGPWFWDKTFWWAEVYMGQPWLPGAQGPPPVGTCLGCWDWRIPRRVFVHRPDGTSVKIRYRAPQKDLDVPLRRRQKALATRWRGMARFEHLHSRLIDRRGAWSVVSMPTAESIGTKSVAKGRWETGFTREDAEFVAHARTDVPRLVEEIRRLRLELARTWSARSDVRLAGTRGPKEGH